MLNGFPTERVSSSIASIEHKVTRDYIIMGVAFKFEFKNNIYNNCLFKILYKH